VSFELTILGSGAAIPTARRNPSSHFITCNDRHILIDCGEGTQMQLRKYGIRLQRISHILISHLHGDHFFGLVGLISTMHLLGRDKGLTIYGPEPLETIIRSQLEIGHARLNFDISFVKIVGKKQETIFEDKLIEIHSFPLQHRIPTNGFIIREKVKERRLLSDELKGKGLKLEHLPLLKKGHDILLEDGNVIHAEDVTLPPKPSYSYAYCSDTVYDESIIPFIQGVSILYHEATFIEKEKERAKETWHTTASQAGEIARRAGVGKLIIGHFSARYENTEIHLHEARERFEKVYAAEDGLHMHVYP
jgi:ribonuclease Z